MTALTDHARDHADLAAREADARDPLFLSPDWITHVYDYGDDDTGDGSLSPGQVVLVWCALAITIGCIGAAIVMVARHVIGGAW